MHAYLIIGNDSQSLENYASKLAQKLSAIILPYQINKISEAREVNRFATLSLTQKTAIYLKGIDKATNEALNSLLKLLEEPQKNLYFIATAKKEMGVLPTILSRLSIIRLKAVRPDPEITEFSNNFIKMNLGEKIKYISSLKRSDEAKAVFEKLIEGFHELLHQDTNYNNIAGYIKEAQKTLTSLNSNGNVSIHLTNFLVHIKNYSPLRNSVN